MALTPTDFKARFPEFSAIDDSRIQFFLDDAELEVGEAAWGDLYEKGVMLLAAHFLQLELERLDDDSSGSSTENRVTSKKVGDVQVNFARATASDASEDWYLQTSYGAEYLRLKIRMGMGAVAVGGW